jgi:hypothetical protein
MQRVTFLVGWLALVPAGCAEPDDPQRCLPGATQACLCSANSSGVQTCNESGTSVGACVCDDSDISDTSEDTTDDGAGPDDGDATPEDTSGPDPDSTPTDSAPTPDSADGLNPGDCPVAVITVAQGAEVWPQTRLELDGSSSIAGFGEVVAWEWSVIQPQGSVSTFVPSKFVRNPTFEANITGTYTFRLTVYDAQGRASCVEAEFVVTTAVDDAIRVELTWQTPGDPDQTDTGAGPNSSAGSDLDLHFLHPRANGAYFDWTYDCYSGSPAQEWGFFGPSDNPSLTRDDTDGAGPENLVVSVPEQNVRFQVGTHYLNDWGYGHSLATIRVYIYGVLRDQWSDVRLNMGDMWDSHYIDWPSGIVTRITAPAGVPRITPQYPVDTGDPRR